MAFEDSIDWIDLDLGMVRGSGRARDFKSNRLGDSWCRKEEAKRRIIRYSGSDTALRNVCQSEGIYYLEQDDYIQSNNTDKED